MEMSQPPITDKKKETKGEITSHQSPLNLQSSENILKVRRLSWCSHAYVHLDKNLNRKWQLLLTPVNQSDAGCLQSHCMVQPSSATSVSGPVQNVILDRCVSLLSTIWLGGKKKQQPLIKRVGRFKGFLFRSLISKVCVL